jgi:hypothetical protein
MCPIPNGFRDKAISLYRLYCTLYRRATRHVLTRVAKCIDVDGGIFENVLYATIRKVAVSIPDDIIGFFNWRNPSCRTKALGSTQPLTEMSTRKISGG